MHYNNVSNDIENLIKKNDNLKRQNKKLKDKFNTLKEAARIASSSGLASDLNKLQDVLDKI